MTWFKVDDDLNNHPKARAAGLPAMGLWTVAGSYAARYLTDGFVPDWYVASWPSGPKLARKLVSAGLWTVEAGGWRFHEWHDRNPTRAKVEQERKITRERVARFRNGVTTTVTNAVSNGGCTASPSRPDPRRGSSRSDQSSPVTRETITRPVDNSRVGEALRAHAPRRTITDEHVARVVRDVLDRAGTTPLDPTRYVLAAITSEPARYLPTPAPPPFRKERTA